jgi:uncharacterized sulfatase
MPLLKSDKNGLLDPLRDWVITGRERHVAAARPGNLPYPMRSLRTPDYAYIRNFETDRWPMGAPGMATNAVLPEPRMLENNTFAAYADMDGSPTKAWFVAHRDDPQWKWNYELAFGKRPSEELYDVHADPDMVNNLATNPAYAEKKKELAARLMKKLVEAEDPRVVGDGKTFDRPPFTDPEPGAVTRDAGKGKAKAKEKAVN